MRTVTGLFDTYEHATQAVHALKDAGIRSADISLVANKVSDIDAIGDDKVGEGATTGAELGAVLGGAGGLLAGLGVLAIPGLGPVVAGGWLFATAIGAVAGAGVGAATGGLVGALTGAGISEADAHVYAESVRRGGSLVTARVDDARVDQAAAILRNANGIDVDDRRRIYQAQGWQAYEDNPLDPELQEARDYRDRFPVVPPII